MKRAALLAAAALLLIAAADPKTETEHVVQPGETLSGIAQRAEVPRVLIVEANGLTAPYTLRAGQRLVIPRRRNHTVKPGETGLKIALEYAVPWRMIAEASGIDPKAPLRAGQKLVIPTLSAAPAVAPNPAPSPTSSAAAIAWRWPVEGHVRRAFAARGGKSFHDGIDILSTKGTAVRASAAGRVIFAGDGPREYGKTVIVHHGERWTTTYSFLDRITVSDGEQVRAGERIGLVGETGLATEPQLHFEIRRERAALDPARYLPAQPR
ncbi:MAG: peptidoglycan DD-metalloendopeptidase family protein [Novosphingobium sp.]